MSLSLSMPTLNVRAVLLSDLLPFTLSSRKDDSPCISTKVMPDTLSLSTFLLLDLPVIYKVSVLPSGPLWPCTEACTCVGPILSVFRWCFTLSGLTYLSGKKFPGMDISHRQLWNVFTEWPGDPQRQVCSRLCKTVPAVTRQEIKMFFY